MSRVTRGNKKLLRRKKYLKLAKGYFGTKKRLYRTVKEQVEKSLQYAYRDRRNKKRDFRRLWNTRINAGCRLHGMSYSRFIHGLKLSNVEINRKMLAEMAVHNPEGFGNMKEMTGTNIVCISGPSKTADIEAQLVFGAHGPRHMDLIVIRKRAVAAS